MFQSEWINHRRCCISRLEVLESHVGRNICVAIERQRVFMRSRSYVHFYRFGVKTESKEGQKSLEGRNRPDIDGAKAAK